MARGGLRFMGKAIGTKMELNKTVIALADKKNSCKRMLILVPTKKGLQPTSVLT